MLNNIQQFDIDLIKLIEDMLRCYVNKDKNPEFEKEVMENACYLLYHHPESSMSDEEILEIRKKILK